MAGTRIRRVALWVGGAVAFYAVLGFLVAPPVVRSQNPFMLSGGELSAARATIIAPKMNAEGIKDSGKATRVDFALK